MLRIFTLLFKLSNLISKCAFREIQALFWISLDIYYSRCEGNISNCAFMNCFRYLLSTHNIQKFFLDIQSQYSGIWLDIVWSLFVPACPGPDNLALPCSFAGGLSLVSLCTGTDESVYMCRWKHVYLRILLPILALPSQCRLMACTNCLASLALSFSPTDREISIYSHLFLEIACLNQIQMIQMRFQQQP